MTRYYLIIGIAFLSGCFLAILIDFKPHKAEPIAAMIPDADKNQEHNTKKAISTTQETAKLTVPNTNNTKLSENAPAHQVPSELQQQNIEELTLPSREELSNSIQLSETLSHVVNGLSKEHVGGWGIEEKEGKKIPWVSLHPNGEIPDTVAQLLQKNPDIEIRYDSLYSLDTLEKSNIRLNEAIKEVLDNSELEDAIKSHVLYNMIDMENNQLIVAVKKDREKNDLITSLIEEHIVNTSDVPVKIIFQP